MTIIIYKEIHYTDDKHTNKNVTPKINIDKIYAKHLLMHRADMILSLSQNGH